MTDSEQKEAVSALETPLVAKQESIDKDIEELREKLRKAEENKTKIAEKRLKLKEMPPLLKAGLENIISKRGAIDEKKTEVKTMQDALDEDIANWKKSASTDFNMDEDIVNDLVTKNGEGRRGRAPGSSGVEESIMEVLRKNPDGMAKADLANEVSATYGHHKGSVERLLSDKSDYVSGGTLMQRGLIKKVGDKIVKV